MIGPPAGVRRVRRFVPWVVARPQRVTEGSTAGAFGGGCDRLRILIFHGYLLRGTGSNIYNAELARSLVDLGHEVHLFCQEQRAAEYDFVDVVGRWRDGKLEVERLREPVRCTVYVPDIGRILPVYVADHYAGFDARPFPLLTDGEIEGYISANVAAIRDVVAAVRPDVALANHVVMGPVILARALGGTIPYAVKIDGSALEYTARPHAGACGKAPAAPARRRRARLPAARTGGGQGQPGRARRAAGG